MHPRVIDAGAFESLLNNLIAVYHSGKEDLFESTLALLAYNKKRCAELAVLRAKEQKSWQVEMLM